MSARRRYLPRKTGLSTRSRWVQLRLLLLSAIALTGRHVHAQVEFTRDIRPILVQKCYSCHGPDDAVRKAGLRFDRRADAIAPLRSGLRPIVPGDPAASELVRRILSTDPDIRMPPPDSAEQLTAGERELLQQWIADGAAYELHWSFLPPQDPEIPPAAFPQWQRNTVDAFVGSRLQQAGLTPSLEADRVTLVRRLSFDLRGLPPTIAEVDAFTADQSADAYEQLVRRFLASDHFGEKLAIDWLDLARYGDTNGYHADSHRDVWLYRDWVIDAFNSNLPFDRFIQEQIAGDLLPDATDQQHIASGFNRNAPFNEEGGADPDEFSVVYAVDRANTTGQALLGLTFGCAQCHNHKYDPISQQEYYEFYAFFNSVAGEPGGGGENGHHGIPVPPTMVARSPLRQKEISQLEQSLLTRTKHLEQTVTSLMKENSAVRTALLQWAAAETSALQDRRLTVRSGLILHLDATDANANGTPDAEEFTDQKRTVAHWLDRSGQQRNAVAQGTPHWERNAFPGGSPAITFNGEHDFLRTTEGGQLLQDGYTMIAAVAFGQKSAHQMLVIWGDEAQGKRRALWRTAGANPTLSFNGYAADVIGSQPLPPETAQIALVFQNQGSNQVALERNGQPGGQGAPTLARYTNKAITIGANNAGGETVDAAVAEVLIYDRGLTDEERAAVGSYLAAKYAIQTTWQNLPPDVARILERDSQAWTAAEWLAVTRHYMSRISPDNHPDLRDEFTILAELQQRIRELQTATTTMVMREMDDRRPAFILARGDFQQPGRAVTPNVPAVLGRLPEDRLQTRLDLARWLTRSDHPLVSRVRVNHLWKMLMGTGLVRTVGDFGTQGELPSHPELLDWLAQRFVHSGWDTKSLLFEIVTSATYRQQSEFRKNTLQADPLNRLLSRSPRFRLTAEEIRDMALASSGQLNPLVGGPSVRPYQPPNYFSANSGLQWPVSSGDQMRRRAIYTYLQRTAPFAAHLIFDAPSRQICTASRPRTNTPLQALVMMNDPLFVQAAGALADRTMATRQGNVTDRLRFLFRSVLSRTPAAEELELLTATLHEQLRIYENDSAAATALLRSAGHAETELPDPWLAAWTNVAGVVLNLDEAITRE